MGMNLCRMRDKESLCPVVGSPPSRRYYLVAIEWTVSFLAPLGLQACSCFDPREFLVVERALQCLAVTVSVVSFAEKGLSHMEKGRRGQNGAVAGSSCESVGQQCHSRVRGLFLLKQPQLRGSPRCWQCVVPYRASPKRRREWLIDY